MSLECPFNKKVRKYETNNDVCKNMWKAAFLSAVAKKMCLSKEIISDITIQKLVNK